MTAVSRPILSLALLGLLIGCGDVPHGAPPNAPDGSQLPGLAAHPGGGAVMSWVEPDGEGHRLRFATYRDGVWSEPGTVSRGDDWFVNWADFPSVRVIDERFWVAHWLVRHGWNAHAYDIAVSISRDAGRTWSEPLRPHADGTPTEHGFVSIYPIDDAAGLVWLDGRKTLENTSGDRVIGMMLRGARLSRDGEVDESLIDPLVCDCCQTDVAVSSEAPLLVYRDRSQEEVRDIRLARREEAGWEPGPLIAEDGWQVFGCPVNGPAIDAHGSQVGVAWYSQGSGSPRVQFARSADGGRSFGDAVLIDADGPIGRVDVAIDQTGCAVVSWIGREDSGAAELRYRSIGMDGAVSATQVLTRIAATRPSGFPRMANLNGGVLIAWTDILQDSSRVRVQVVDHGCEETPAGAAGHAPPPSEGGSDSV